MDGSAFRRRVAYRDRLPALVLTLGLQAAFLAVLIYSLQRVTPPMPVRETILRLPRLIEPRVRPKTIDARGLPRPRAAAPLSVTPTPNIAPRFAPGMAPSQSDIQSLGRALNDCTPENYANLPPERRAHCARPGEGVAVQQAPPLMGGRSHVKDEAHWAEEYAREQSPVILPCLGGLDILCLLKKIATGEMSDFTDPRTWPHYQVQQIPPEDFYKIEQAYDAWHKAHRESHLAPAH
jgi:hypothetical protein